MKHFTLCCRLPARLLFGGLCAAISLIFLSGESFTQANFWQRVRQGTFDGHVNALALNSSGNIFAATDSSFLLRSTDAGVSWTQLKPDSLVSSYFSLTVNSSDHLFVGGGGTVYGSTDNGNIWTANAVTDAGGILSLAINSSGHIFAGSNGIFRSTDNGNSWTQPLTGQNFYAIVISSSGQIFAGSPANSMYRSTENGVTWTPDTSGLVPPGEVFSLALHPSGTIYLGSGFGKLYRSTNNGDSWTEVMNTGLSPNGQIWALAITPTGPTAGHIYFGSNDSSIYRSTDNGMTWTQVATGLINTDVSALRISTAGPSAGYVFAGTFKENIYRTVYPVPNPTLLDPAIGVRGQTMNVVLSGSGFISSVTTMNWGTGITVNSITVNNFNQLTANISIAFTAPTGPRNVSVNNPEAQGGWTSTLTNGFTVNNPVPTATTISPTSSTRGSLLNITINGTNFIDGVSSASFGSEITVNSLTVVSHTQMRTNVKIDTGATLGTRNVTVTNAGPGGGTATLTNGFEVVSGPPTSVELIEQAPTEYALLQNYPNPFNPTTVISYQLPVASFVTLKLYNILGGKVATLVNGMQEAGYKSVEFNAENFPSGIYVYRLTVGTYINVRKMLLLK